MTVKIVFDIRYHSIIRKSRDFSEYSDEKIFARIFSARLRLAKTAAISAASVSGCKNLHVLHYNPNYAVINGYIGYIMHEKDTQ